MRSAELALRLRVETLIAGAGEVGMDEAIGALADIEAIAAALAATGAMDADGAQALVADTVDALAVRGASWVEPTAVDLDVRRLYDLVAGAPRPRLRRVVPVATTGALTSVDLWDDRAEVRVAGGPSLHIEAVAPSDRVLELRDEHGAELSVDLTVGRGASEGGATGSVDAAEYLARLEAHATATARRDPSVATLNAQRRRLVAVGEALGASDLARRFDHAVAAAAVDHRPPVLVEVVPVAVRTPFGWVLSIERWSDHWRAVVASGQQALWTAVGPSGGRYGGDVVDAGVVRFDPPLPDGWASVTVQHLAGDGTSVEVEVTR